MKSEYYNEVGDLMSWALWLLLGVLILDIITNVFYYWTRRQVDKANKILTVVGGYLYQNDENFREHCQKLSGLSRSEWEKRVAAIRK